MQLSYTRRPWLSGEVVVQGDGRILLADGRRVAAVRRTLDELSLHLGSTVSRVPGAAYAILGVYEGADVRLSEGASVADLVLALGAKDVPSVTILDRYDAARLVPAAEFALIKLQGGDAIEIPLVRRSTLVSIVGGIVRPGTVEVAGAPTLGAALAERGGLSPRAKPDEIFIDRMGETLGPYRLPSGADVKLQGGDVIRIATTTTASYVSVLGAVTRPGLIEVRPNTRLVDAIRDAGGLSVKTDGLLIIVRSVVDPSRGRKVYEAGRIMASPLTSPLVQPGDIIEIGYPPKKSPG